MAGLQRTTDNRQRTNLFLLGYRGSGKSTIGRLLAQRLGWDRVDTDEQVIGAAGTSIKAIFEQHGEAHFRELEARAVAAAAAGERRVVSLGGGAILAEANRRVIAAANVVVYLRADAEELWRRIAGDRATADMRPNLTALAGGLEEIRHLLAQREPIYRELATAEVDVTGKSPQAVADEVMRLLGTTR